MLRIFPNIILFFAVSITCSAQVGTPERYRNFVFTDVVITKNISYYLDPNSKPRHHEFDLYQPSGDSEISRPLIIWIHGGGFKYGSKNSRAIPIWSKSFAQRGYVCAAINYRPSKKKTLSQFPALVDGCYSAIKDLNHAILFLKENYRQYNIDTNRIILAGNSAGAMVALQAGYSNFHDLAKLALRIDTGSNGQENHVIKPAAIVNMWGAVFNLEWLKNSEIPIVSVHGARDRVVPFKKKDGPLYGSYLIHAEADKLQIPNSLKVYEGYGHELQKHFIPFFAGRPVRRRWKEAETFVANFLYNTLFKNSQL